MALQLQFGVLTRNRRLDAIEVELGAAPVLTIWNGAIPANCAAANAGTVLVTVTLPSDWMSNASGGTKVINPTGAPWSDPTADNSGTALHFRIHKAGGGTCELQGTVGMSGTDMIIDNNVIVAGQTVSITSFTLTDANA